MESVFMTNQKVFFGQLLTALTVLTVIFGLASESRSEQAVPPANTVLLDFYGTYCPPCRAMRPVIEQLKKAGYPVRSINVNEEPALAQKYGITNIPCFMMVSDGRVVSRTVGITTANELASICQKGINDAYASQRKRAIAQSNAPKMNNPRTPSNVQIIPVSKNKTENERSPLIESNSSNLLAPERLLASTVRIRVKTSVCDHGTGTIIDSRNKRALILTCGHLFREYAKEHGGRIEVDLFGESPLQNVEAKYICHDEESDLGLICIEIDHPVAVIPVAPLNYQALRGSAVASAGCDNGRLPTVQPSQIVAINKCLGPANMYASGASVQGRSGGGLFSKDGYLIGVTLANVPGENQALYSSYPAIHELLNKQRLAAVISSPRNDSVKLAKNDMIYMPKTMPKPEMNLQLTTERTDRSPEASDVESFPIANADVSQQKTNVVEELPVESQQPLNLTQISQSEPAPAEAINILPPPVENNAPVKSAFKVRPDIPSWPPRF